MTHSLKDELTFIKAPAFKVQVGGSPAGEIKKAIYTPSIKMVDPEMYDGITWDIIKLDGNFKLEERLEFCAYHSKVMTMPPKKFKFGNLCELRGEC